jgi:cathepsin L
MFSYLYNINVNILLLFNLTNQNEDNSVSISALNYTPLFQEDVDHQKHHWEAFKTRHLKSYVSVEEEHRRFKIFLANIKDWDDLNLASLSKGGDAPYGISQFSDLTSEEFRLQYLTARPFDANQLKNSSNVKIKVYPQLSVPSGAIDWSSQGYVTAVKHQRQCGSCFAFAAAEQIESDAMISCGLSTPPILSTGQLTECTYGRGINACDGGYEKAALNYVMEHGGIDYDATYPYSTLYNVKGTKSQVCKPTPVDASYVYPFTVSNVNVLNGEKDMALHVLYNGPIILYVNATTWQGLDGYNGVYTGCSSSAQSTDHSVQVVGVDTVNGFWIIRNSWGPTFGNNGYLKIPYNSNSCGIAKYPALYTNVYQVQTSGKCTGGLIYGDNCYYLNKYTGVTWQQCRTQCASKSTSMLCIDSDATNSWLSQHVASNTWIGYTDIANKGSKNYYWYPGCSSTYTNWASGQPDNTNNNEDYAQFWTSSGQWNDNTPQTTATCSCQKSLISPIPVQTCAAGWVPYGETCYQFNTASSYTWIGCYNYCANQLSGVTVTMFCIHDAVENEWVFNNAGNNAWIGYTDDNRYAPSPAGGVHSKQYGWVYGCTSSYTNWASGEPSNSGNNEDYAQFWTSTGQWNDWTPQGNTQCACQYSL